MYYGADYANADDVVGHEMTHGVISHNSDLFYWGQSGAMNESIADIMGEIIDHRNTLVAGDAGLAAGEDLPGGALRNMSNPHSPAFNDPDRMTSAHYYPKPVATRYRRRGRGAHQQRRRQQDGVPDLAGRLVQRSDDHGHRRRRPDAEQDGARCTTTSIVRLTSGSDYANLADVLEQTCADFASANPRLHRRRLRQRAQGGARHRAAHHADQRPAAGGRRGSLPQRGRLPRRCSTARPARRRRSSRRRRAVAVGLRHQR